jgi:regulator of replication initiation timing
LISEESSTPPEPTKAKETPQKSKQISNRSTAGEPDLTKFISRAALRASAHPAPGGDSFYVVPTTGHTATYANILSFAEKEKRRMAASMHSADSGLFDDPDHDDFVDAHETPMPPSPGIKRFGSKGKSSEVKELKNVVEELYIENKSLKDCIDKLSKRLHAFEMSAQSSSLALQESMRMMRPSSPVPHPSTAGGVDFGAKTTAKIRQLEEQVEAGEKEMQRLGKENEKLKNIVARYRERWEKLKDGAKARRQDGTKDDKGGGSKDGDGGRAG